MPLYAIRRRVGQLTREEVEAAGFRATVCAAEHDGLHWERSFWDQEKGELLCYYVANSPEQVRLHSHQSNIPCDDITEVSEILPGVYTTAPVGV